jgi:hypothetical protein
MRNIKKRLTNGLFQKSASLEDKIKNKLNLVTKKDVLRKTYKNKDLNIKNYEAFDSKPLSQVNNDPHWGTYNSHVHEGVDPSKDLMPGIGGKERTTQVMKVAGKPDGSKALLKAPLDWRELKLSYDNKHPKFNEDVTNYKNSYRDWVKKRNTAVSSGLGFTEKEPTKPTNFFFKRIGETSLFLDPDFRSTHREVAFNNLADKSFGLGGFVARTSLFRHPKTGLPWSAQEYIEGNPVTDANQLTHHEKTGDLHKLAIMDVILGNNDRHAGNSKLDMKGNLKLIDNAGTFDYGNRFRTKGWPHYAAHLIGKPLPGNVHQWIDNLNPEDFKKTLKESNVPDILSNVAVNRMMEVKKWSDSLKDDPFQANDLSGALELAKVHRLDRDDKFINDAKAMIGRRIKSGESPTEPAKPDQKTVFFGNK